MSVRAGVWIDHKQAIVVLVTDAGKEIKKISSDIEKPARTRSHNTYTPNDFVAEDRLERRLESHLKKFYEQVIACLQKPEALLILGPGEAKGEFQKRLKIKKLRGIVVEVKTADRMTDRQLLATVTQHFATIPAKKSISPKKTPRARLKIPIRNSQ
jgi:stalled ribosome rescue protein Dom34